MTDLHSPVWGQTVSIICRQMGVWDTRKTGAGFNEKCGKLPDITDITVWALIKCLTGLSVTIRAQDQPRPHPDSSWPGKHPRFIHLWIIIENRAVVTSCVRSAVVCCCMNGRGGCGWCCNACPGELTAQAHKRDCGMGECLTSARHCPGRPGPHLNSPLSLSLPNLFRDSRHCLSLQPPPLQNYLRPECILCLCPCLSVLPMSNALMAPSWWPSGCSAVLCSQAPAMHILKVRPRAWPGWHDMTTTHSLFDPFAVHVQPRMILVMSRPHPPINTFFTRGLFDIFTRVKCLHLTF